MLTPELKARLLAAGLDAEVRIAEARDRANGCLYQAPTSGIDLIATERQRQQEVIGCSAEHDDQYNNQELTIYAQYWLSPEGADSGRAQAKEFLQASDTNGWEDEWFKYDQRTPVQRLSRAGALIAAEIDRLQRLEDGCSV